MPRLAAVLIAASSLFVAAEAQTRAPAEPRPGDVVVLAELFTSEGCESCPPADRLLETLLKEQPAKGVFVVPLSEHVTYWDHQGWKDPFSAEQFTTRQKEYGGRFNLDSIYTPQLVIDGTRELVGSDDKELKRTLSQPGGAKPGLDVELKTVGHAVSAAISGPGLAVEPAALFVALTEDDLVVDVKRGENAGRTMRHSGVVRILQSLGDARTTTLNVKPEWKRDKLRVVAFVQSKKTSQILSVGWQAIK